jgi:DNA-binding response OmpR family regulator
MRSGAPVIALNEAPNLEPTLGLYAAGVDDVVRKPVHVREIVARVGAILRRTNGCRSTRDRRRHAGLFRRARPGGAGRDPALAASRAAHPGIYGQEPGPSCHQEPDLRFRLWVVKEGVEESAIESHVSKPRKKLRERLGFDPIDSKRQIGSVIEPWLSQRLLLAA